MTVTTIRLPGECHAILADRLDRLVRDVIRAPEWARDPQAAHEEVVIHIERRPRAQRKAS